MNSLFEDGASLSCHIEDAEVQVLRMTDMTDKNEMVYVENHFTTDFGKLG